MSAKSISHYEILQPLGEGGMGTVYRALDTRLGRPVAVKLLRDEATAGGERRKRFIQEARAASALNHPHIITIYDIGEERSVDFIAMEYVAGASLAQLIERRRLRIEEYLRFAIQIADALAAAHAAGIVHRDLKPANIMVSDAGSIKVLDFGLAKLTESAGGDDPRLTTETGASAAEVQTERGMILGTAAYMSPEQAEGKPADPRSDVFSFGAVLYEMVTGQRAFNSDTKMSTLAAILTREPEPPSRIVSGVPRDLEKLIVRCLRKDPARRWQSMADVKVAIEDVAEEWQSDRADEAPGAQIRWWTRPSALLGGAVVMVAIAAAVFAAWGSAPSSTAARPFLMRLTSDVGWTDHPAISRDGRILAYASDRAGEGNLDIWVQQVPDGVPVRLTRHDADEVDPSFSADGSKVAFHSSRDGGGVFVIPTLGGDERLFAKGGYSPRFSPDGKWIAYGVAESPGSGLYVAPAAGGPARLLTAGFHLAQAPVWSPDGRHLLFWGQRDRDAPPENNVDWYVTPVVGGAAVRTDARRVLLRDGFQAFQGLPAADAWVPGMDRIVFHGHLGDSWNMWQVTISPESWQVSDTPQAVTFGTTDEASASVTMDGRMTFISRTMSADIWSLALDAERGTVIGGLRRVTADAADDYDPTLSADGRLLVFRSRRAGRFAVMLRDVLSGTESLLTQTAGDDYPAISADGTKVAYSSRQNDQTAIFALSPRGGIPQQVCARCGDVEQWSPDGRAILYVTNRDPSGVGLLEVGGVQRDNWLQHRGYGIYNARLSPDAHWVAFNARADRTAPARVFVAQSSLTAVAADWIEVTGAGDAPAWSPDGHLLFFWSDRDGSPCLWAQRLEAATKRPAGPPLSIQHFHSRGLSPRNLYLGAPDIAVARDKIVFNIGEHTGNIWITKLRE